MGPKSPGPAELIRASQRDNEFIKRLKDDIDEMILEVFGQRVWLRCQEYSGYGSGIIYYALTNLLGYQTLGEEYVGVIQVDKSGRSVPTSKAISLMIFTQVLGTPFMSYILKMIENFNEQQKSDRSSNVSPYLTTFLETVLRVGRLCQHFTPFLSQLHLAMFYINGTFYHFSKRLSGIQYLLIRNYLGDHDAASRRNLKYLMWLSIINLAITASHDSFRYVASEKSKKSTDFDLAPSLSNAYQGSKEQSSASANTANASDVDPTKKCSLCLEARRHCSVTPCGHLFCWECIMDWLKSEGACPICRESVAPSRIVPLQNFS